MIALFKNIYQYSGYLFGSFASEVRYRYAGTVLGFFWFIVNPLLEIAIYSIVFTQILDLRSAGTRDVSYVFFLMTGLFPWLVFSQILSRGSNALNANAVYLRRLAIPSDIFVAKEALISFFTLFVYIVALIIISLFSGQLLSVNLLALVPVSFLLVMMAFGLALGLAHLRVLFPDLGEIISILVNLWRWTLPIMYTIDRFPEEIKPFFEYNPAYYLIESFHQILINGQFPPPQAWGLLVGWTLTFLLIGSAIAGKLRHQIREEL